MKNVLFKGLLGTMIMACLFLSCSSNDDENNQNGTETADESKTYVEQAVLNSDGSIAIPSDCQAMNEKNNDFSWRVFNYIASQSNANSSDNVVISPYSLAVDLAMLNNGAAGESQAEIKQFLAFGNYSVDDINNYFAVLTRGLTQVDASTTFTSVNALWYDKNISLKKAFSSTLESWYKTESYAAEMRTQQTFDEINSWASDNTNGMIEKFFDNIQEIPDIAALLNAFYLKSPWQYPFNKDLTASGDFYLSDGSTVSADFMHNATCLNYVRGDKESVVFLPMGKNGKMDMFFALPNDGVSIASTVADLQSSWSKLSSAAKKTDVMIDLPRFSSEYVSKWEECLMSMGCTKIFSESEADFSNMTTKKGVYVSRIKQKAKINVAEGGIEFAAVTGTSMITTGDEDVTYKKLKFNRPFVFGMREKSTGVIIFVGCVNNPSK